MKLFNAVVMLVGALLVLLPANVFAATLPADGDAWTEGPLNPNWSAVYGFVQLETSDTKMGNDSIKGGIGNVWPWEAYVRFNVATELGGYLDLSNYETIEFWYKSIYAEEQAPWPIVNITDSSAKRLRFYLHNDASSSQPALQAGTWQYRVLDLKNPTIDEGVDYTAIWVIDFDYYTVDEAVDFWIDGLSFGVKPQYVEMPTAGWTLFSTGSSDTTTWPGEFYIDDGTDTKNIADAETDGWINSTLYYYDSAEDTPVYKAVPTDVSYLSWEQAYYLWSYKDNLKLMFPITN